MLIVNNKKYYVNAKFICVVFFFSNIVNSMNIYSPFFEKKKKYR